MSRFVTFLFNHLPHVIHWKVTNHGMSEEIVDLATYVNHLISKEAQQVRNHNFNPLSANLTKWSNTIKQFVQPTNCLSVFDHFVGLALKGLTVFQPHSYIQTQMWKQTILTRKGKYYRQNWFWKTVSIQSYLIFSVLITQVINDNGLLDLFH